MNAAISQGKRTPKSWTSVVVKLEESGQVRVDRDVIEVVEHHGHPGVFREVDGSVWFYTLDTVRGKLTSEGVEDWSYDPDDPVERYFMRVRFCLEDPAPAQVRVEVNRAIGSLRQRVLDEMEACRRRLSGIDRALEDLYHTQEEAEG